MTRITSASAVQRFLTGVESGQIPLDLYATDAVLDATVPGWRFQAHGPDAIIAEYARWFTGPCRLHIREQRVLPDGALVRYVQDYDLGPASITTHHMHLLTVVDDRITRDVVFCGGRWSQEVLAKMGDAAHAD